MNADNKWKRKARALARLAEDQRGKPEGDLAREKLQAIIAKHPEARDYQPVAELFERDITFRDMKGIDKTGSWSGGTPEEVIARVIADYKARIIAQRQEPIGELEA